MLLCLFQYFEKRNVKLAYKQVGAALLGRVDSNFSILIKFLKNEDVYDFTSPLYDEGIAIERKRKMMNTR